MLWLCTITHTDTKCVYIFHMLCRLLMSPGDQSLSIFIHKYAHTHTHMHARIHVQCSTVCCSPAGPKLNTLRVAFCSGACIITGPHASSLDHMHHHWTTCIITGPHACCRQYAQACWTYGRRRTSGQAWGPPIFSGSMSHGL